jgi:uncharacterized protein (DUF433 family)
VSPRPEVTVSPSMRFGRPHVKGVSVDDIVGMLSAGESVATVGYEYHLTRPDVLVACWYVGQYGLPESPRRWRTALREWAAEVGQAMWDASTCDYEAIPDPPIGVRTPAASPVAYLPPRTRA